MHYVYILVCNDDSLYTGITDNVERRFHGHQKGRGGRYTSSHGAKRIMYIEKQKTRREALKRELQIKSWPRIKKLKLFSNIIF